MRKNGAALYWMGWKLNQALDVPIGLVNASWGATKIDGWIDQTWAKDHGTGHAKGVACFWYNRWTDFMKAGGPEVYEKKIFEWNKRFDPASNFVNTKPSLHDPDFVEDESWKELTIDGRGFQCDPFPEGFTGEVWMRATFELTEADLKKNWSIGYSESYGQDMNYLNGHAFGGSGNPNHGYGVPIKEHGRVGKNVLAVRYKVYAASKEGRPGGMLKPVSIALWPSRAESHEMKFKACIGEQMPKDIWNHPECRKPTRARSTCSARRPWTRDSSIRSIRWRSRARSGTRAAPTSATASTPSSSRRSSRDGARSSLTRTLSPSSSPKSARTSSTPSRTPRSAWRTARRTPRRGR